MMSNDRNLQTTGYQLPLMRIENSSSKHPMMDFYSSIVLRIFLTSETLIVQFGVLLGGASTPVLESVWSMETCMSHTKLGASHGKNTVKCKYHMNSYTSVRRNEAKAKAKPTKDKAG